MVLEAYTMLKELTRKKNIEEAFSQMFSKRLIRRFFFCTIHILISGVILLSTCLCFLILTVPSVQIVGDREVHVKAGTSVTLKCLISNCLEEPAYVFWYHGERRLLDDDDQIPGKKKIKYFFFQFG